MSVKRTADNLLARTAVGRKFLLGRHLRQYSDECGWALSHASGKSVDRDGKPIPWFNYAATAFLGRRLVNTMRLFEYGSGNSTRWFSERVAEVVSVEHDAAWFEQMRDSLPGNVKYEHCALAYGGDYAQTINRYPPGFNIVVIDGRDRVNCAINALQALATDGVFIWDNSDRSQYQQGYDHLTAQGFRRVDFAGLGPIVAITTETSIFYRDGNCLGL